MNMAESGWEMVEVVVCDGDLTLFYVHCHDIRPLYKNMLEDRPPNVNFRIIDQPRA